MSNADTPYRDVRWKAARLEVLRRDGYRCRIQLPKCKTRATHADHIEDWRDGGAWFDPANLRAACASCNTAQRNTRVAARARAMRGDYSLSEPGDWIVITPYTWLTAEEEAKYGPNPAPGEPSRRVRR